MGPGENPVPLEAVRPPAEAWRVSPAQLQKWLDERDQGKDILHGPVVTFTTTQDRKEFIAIGDGELRINGVKVKTNYGKITSLKIDGNFLVLEAGSSTLKYERAAFADNVRYLGAGAMRGPQELADFPPDTASQEPKISPSQPPPSFVSSVSPAQKPSTPSASPSVQPPFAQYERPASVEDVTPAQIEGWLGKLLANKFNLLHLSPPAKFEAKNGTVCEFGDGRIRIRGKTLRWLFGRSDLQLTEVVRVPEGMQIVLKKNADEVVPSKFTLETFGKILLQAPIDIRQSNGQLISAALYDTEPPPITPETSYNKPEGPETDKVEREHAQSWCETLPVGNLLELQTQQPFMDQQGHTLWEIGRRGIFVRGQKIHVTNERDQEVTILGIYRRSDGGFTTNLQTEKGWVCYEGLIPILRSIYLENVHVGTYAPFTITLPNKEDYRLRFTVQ